MSRKPLPETRGSHLAGQRERERAMKNYQQAKQQQQKATPQMAEPKTNVVPMQEPLRMKKSGKPIQSRDRDTIVGEIAKRSMWEVAADIAEMSPAHSHSRAMAILKCVEKDPAHRFWGTIRDLLGALARRYRNEIPFPRPAPHQAAPTSALAAAAQPSTTPQSSVEGITTVVVAVLKAMGISGASGAPTAPQLPLKAGDFSTASDADLRDYLNAHHRALGKRLESAGAYGGTSAAWNRSYRAFHAATGVDVRAMAREETRSKGHEVLALDVIERLGELRRFWEIVRGLGA